MMVMITLVKVLYVMMIILMTMIIISMMIMLMIIILLMQVMGKEQLYDLFQQILNIKKFEHQLLYNAMQVPGVS